MRTSRFRYPALAALVTAGALLGAWLSIPNNSNGVQASAPNPATSGFTRAASKARRAALPQTTPSLGPARLNESDRRRPNSANTASGVLDLRVAGLTIPAGAQTHAVTVARLTRVNTTMVPAGQDWSAMTEVIDGAAAFGEVPVDQHFELLLTGPDGDELLRTTILGPGHGLSPEYASVKVSLGG